VRRTRVVGSGQRRSAAHCRNAARRRRDRVAAVRTPAHGPDSAFKVRRGSVAATRRRRADRWARSGKRRLTGGPLMSMISELKFTPERK
jgi:hypothetical protein